MAPSIAARPVPGAGGSETAAGRRIARALAVLEYCARVYRRNWRGTMFMTFLSPVLFLAAMGFGLGGFVDGAAAGAGAAGAGAAAGAGSAGGTAADLLARVSYAAFLAPGLLAATCMQTGGFEASYPVMGRLRWDKVYHAVLATPVTVGEIVAGQLGWFAVRLLLVASAYFTVMVGFGLVPGGPLALLAIPVGVLTGMSFAAPMAAFAATQRNDNGFSVIFRFLVTPLFLFSGTFFPVEQLPSFLQPVAWLTPTYHGVALARDLTLGLAQPGSSLVHLGVLVAAAGAGAVATLVTFRRALVR